MDDIVKAALKKWPNVPHCYGWLALDARGDWYMRDDRTQAAGPFPRESNEPSLRQPHRQAPGNAEHPQGSAEHVIVDRAKALDISLILMTTHGRSGLGRMFFGSVADSVLRHAPCPVLLVRITDVEGATAP